MLAILDNLKMFQSVFNRFHLLCCWMFSRLFQFFCRIRSIIHWQAQTSLHLRYISSMYLEAIFSFYVFLYHFVGNSLFRLVCLGSFSDIIKCSSFSDIIKRYFALFLAKLDFYADCAVRLFVGKQYYRLRVLCEWKIIKRFQIIAPVAAVFHISQVVHQSFRIA